ncbi:MAG: presenilin family intramembrane aspartyl protease [Candidatus Micrarchaeota archaeon]|nr:presenilin family intramembrane aspartyl protease [Candidatus Micrarchaeota archaeon]
MKSVLKLLLLFVVAQLLGLIVMNAFVAGGVARQASVWQFSLEDIFFLVIGMAFTVLLLLTLIKLYTGNLLYKAMEFVVVAAASFVVFYGVGYYAGLGEAEALILAVSLSALKQLFPPSKNAAAVISSAGVATMFAMFLSFWEAVVFLIVMSAYDYVAVFITRHMITLASEFGKRDMSFSITSQETVREKVLVRKRGVVVEEKPVERVERLELGTGDIALPLAFNLVVFKGIAQTNAGAAVSSFIIIGVFSALALGLVLAYVKKRKLFLPALPPILLGTLVGYMLAYVSGAAT